MLWGIRSRATPFDFPIFKLRQIFSTDSPVILPFLLFFLFKSRRMPLSLSVKSAFFDKFDFLSFLKIARISLLPREFFLGDKENRKNYAKFLVLIHRWFFPFFYFFSLKSGEMPLSLSVKSAFFDKIKKVGGTIILFIWVMKCLLDCPVLNVILIK